MSFTLPFWGFMQNPHIGRDIDTHQRTCSRFLDPAINCTRLKELRLCAAAGECARRPRRKHQAGDILDRDDVCRARLLMHDRQLAEELPGPRRASLRCVPWTSS